MIHLLFEQSGTFRDEFIKLGYQAKCYDIANEFNKTNVVIDLFNEIEKEYNNLDKVERERERTIFDDIKEDDLIFAFFPCIRFSNRILLWFQGNNYGERNWSLEKKLEYDLQLHKELSQLYELISKLVIICLKRNLKLIIENPYSEQHYLTRYWCVKPSVIDLDRTKDGDFYKKPTQYFFINLEPKFNMIEQLDIKVERKTIEDTNYGIKRSLISSIYANRFIRHYIVE